MNQESFLQRLEYEAKLQAQLHSNRLLPRQLDSLTTFIGKYPWQVILLVSGILAAVGEVWKKL